MWKNTKEQEPNYIRPILVKIGKLVHIAYYDSFEKEYRVGTPCQGCYYCGGVVPITFDESQESSYYQYVSEWKYYEEIDE